MSVYLERVKRRPRDPDIPDNDHALRFGSAVHYVMEHSRYEFSNYRKQLILEAIVQEGLPEEDIYKIYACCQSLYRIHVGSGLTIIACEEVVEDQTVLGYVDAIGVDRLGRWWIMDLKTAYQWKTELEQRLRRDPQLNLYAAHAVELAARLGLKLESFAGAIYRAVVKPKTRPFDGESLTAYAKRAKVRTHQVVIPMQDLDPETVVAQHFKLRERYEAIRRGEVPEHQILRNYDACMEWNRPCAHWSYCHKKRFTECLKSAIVATDENPIDLATVHVTKPQRSHDMLNLEVTNVSVFPSTKAVRVEVLASLGACVLRKPYYFNSEKDEAEAADYINQCVEAAQKSARTDLYIHLATLADDKAYQSWAQKLCIPNAVPASVKGETTAEAPAPAKKEEAPAAPAKAAKKEEAPVADEAPAAPAAPAKAPKGKKAEKKADEKIYEQGNPEYSAALKAELAAHWGAGWAKAHKEDAMMISAALAKAKVIVLRDGAVAQEFKDAVAQEVEKFAEETGDVL